MKTESSITRNTLRKMAARIAVVTFISTTIAYFHILGNLEQQSLAQLKSYVSERGQRERALFSLAESNHVILKKALLETLADYGDRDPVKEFNQLFVKQTDGVTRNRPEIFDGTVDPGVFIDDDLVINADIRRRVLSFYKIISQYGPAWHSQFNDTYITTPDNIMVIYWPEIPTWAQDAQPNLYMPDEEYVWVADEAHNPDRETVWTGLFFDHVAKVWMVSSETPVYLEDRHIATIGHDITLNQLLERTLNDVLEGAKNMIFSDDGRLIAFSSKTAAIQNKGGYYDIRESDDAHLKSVLTSVLEQEKGDSGVVDSDKEYIAFTLIDEPGWYFLTLYPKSIFVKQAQEVTKFILILGFLSLFIEVLILFFVMRYQIAKPIKAMMQATGRITKGEFEVRLDEGRTDEFGRLSHAFNVMIKAVAERDSLRTETSAIAKELQQFINTANAPIFGIDAQGNVNEWNQTAAKITGFSKEDVLGNNLVETYITEDFRVAVKQVLDNALAGEEAANYEFPLFTKDDKRVMVLLNASSRRNAEGQIIGVLGVGQDITELDKVRAEQASIATEMTQFIDTANAPIFGIDVQGRVNEWNQESESITGFSKTDVMGRDLVADFITDGYKVSVGEVLSKALNGEETANFEFPLFSKTGGSVDVLLNSTTRRDASGQIVGVIGVGQDITELNKVRAEQASIAKELTQFIDTANAPIFGIDVQGRVNEWNQESESITGFSKTDVMGRDLVADFITDGYKVSVGEVLSKALNGEETANYEFPLFSKTGGSVDVLLNSTTRRDASGQIVGVIGVGQDITELNKVRAEQESERKEATAQIIQASKLSTLGEMATSVAHELNQPLNVIRMAAGNSRRRISKGTADIEYLSDKLERIEGQTARATAIIDHMRMFGREAKEQAEPIDPRKVVTNALGLMGEQLRLAGIKVVTEFPEDCSSILGHIIQMEQVVLNLLTNARDAMAERDGEAKITLRVFEDDKGVNITSEDTGGGIPEDVLPRIFDPFYTTKAMGKGTGLGLSVGYGIVRELNGTLVADNINGGARFTITLPSAS